MLSIGSTFLLHPEDETQEPKKYVLKDFSFDIGESGGWEAFVTLEDRVATMRYPVSMVKEMLVIGLIYPEESLPFMERLHKARDQRRLDQKALEEHRKHY